MAVVPDGRHERAGPAAGGEVVAHGRLERIEAQGVVVVGLEKAQVVGAEAGEVRRLGHRAVRLVRGVHDERRLLGLQAAAVLAEAAGPLAGAEQGAQRGRAGGVLDDAGEGVAEAQHLPQPLHDHVLDLGGRRARLPAHALDAEAGRDEVGEHRREVAVGGEVGEEPGMVPVRDARQHDALEVGRDGRQAFGPARRLGRQLRGDLAGLHAAHHRVLGDVLAVVRDPVDQLVAEPAELVGFHQLCPFFGGCGPRVPARAAVITWSSVHAVSAEPRPGRPS